LIGYVALLDVLGFKSIITGDSVDENLKEYLQALEEVTKASDADAAVNYVVFSDSIVLTTGDSVDSFKSILIACSRLLGIMLEKEIPLRGAVTYGQYVYEPSKNGTFVAGKAVVDAYAFETAQDWVGVMLAPFAIKRAPDLIERCRIDDNFEKTGPGLRRIYEKLPWCAVLQPHVEIPFHRKDSFELNNYNGFAIVPTNGNLDPAHIRDSLSKSYDKLKLLEYLAPDPQTQRKFQNTSRWVYNLQGKWHDIAYLKECLEEESKSAL
jgi:hypothetical protein